jgi:type II secretory pathway component PulK
LGFVTLLVLILFTMLSAYGLEMYLKAHLENKMVRREANSRQAVYAAEGGIEWVKVKLDGDSAFSGGRLMIGEGTVDVMVTGAPSGYRVTSVAQNGLAKRRLEVNLVKSMNRWVITEYQELHADE